MSGIKIKLNLTRKYTKGYQAFKRFLIGDDQYIIRKPDL